jgi:hypothetical protein
MYGHLWGPPLSAKRRFGVLAGALSVFLWRGWGREGVAINVGAIQHRHGDVRAGKWRQAAVDVNTDVACSTVSSNFELEFLTSIFGIYPVFGEGRKIKARLKV